MEPHPQRAVSGGRRHSSGPRSVFQGEVLVWGKQGIREGGHAEQKYSPAKRKAERWQGRPGCPDMHAGTLGCHTQAVGSEKYFSKCLTRTDCHLE